MTSLWIRILAPLLFLAPACAQPPIFAPASFYTFNPGQGPFYSVAADFNGDGNLDVAFADEGNGGSLTVLLGDGRGGFTRAPGSPYNAGSQPGGVIAADFNGDGKMDLAIESTLTYPGGGSIVVLLGDGKGGFQFGAGSGPLREFVDGFGVGDFNSDGMPDIAVSTGTALVILLGDGKGGLVRRQSPSGRGAVSGRIAVGNFTGNGNSDVVVVNSEGLTVFVCDGKNGFTALPIAPLGPATGAGFAMADFNGDGSPDLLLGNTVMLNDGKGRFSRQTPIPFAVSDFSSQPFAIADFNGDGKLDLAISDVHQVAIFLGDGAGGFTLSAGSNISGPNDYLIPLAGDFNNDGEPDLVIAGGAPVDFGGQGAAWLNTLPALPIRPKKISFQAGAGQSAPKPIAVSTTAGLVGASNQAWLSYANGQVFADTTGLPPGHYNGTIRFSAPNYFGVAVQISLTVNAPAGVLIHSPAIAAPFGSQFFSGDFNGDGIPDLLIEDNNVLTVWFGDGAGNFTPSPKHTDTGIRENVALADFNSDGRLDVALFDSSANQIQVLFGDVSGGFTKGPITSLADGFYFSGPIAADFNGDGIPDLVFPNLGAGLTVLLGDGHGGFRAVPLPALPKAQISQVAVGDFNGDGSVDIALVPGARQAAFLFGLPTSAPDEASSGVNILLGDGAGNFTLGQDVELRASQYYPEAIQVGDWNGDGLLDLALSFGQAGSSQIAILIGKGDGSFVETNDIPVASAGNINSLTMADFNGDGNPDLLVSLQNDVGVLFFGSGDGGAYATFQTAYFTVYLGDGKGNFAAPPDDFRVPGFPSPPPIVADVNNDGRPDIIFSDGNELNILLGGRAVPSMSLTQIPPNPFTIGQTVTLSAQLSPGPLAYQLPTGQISLLDGATTLLTKPVASPTTFLTNFSPGTHYFTAAYPGDLRFGPATASLNVVETGPPAAIRALSNAFPLRAIVTDANNNPVPGAAVTFSAPTNGPGGLFGNSPTAAVLTDAGGVATAPLFTPNASPGSYFITAATTPGGLTCTFAVAN